MTSTSPVSAAPLLQPQTSSSWSWFSSPSNLPRTNISEANRHLQALSERVVQLERQLAEEKTARERSETELRQYAEEIAHRCGLEVRLFLRSS